MSPNSQPSLNPPWFQIGDTIQVGSRTFTVGRCAGVGGMAEVAFLEDEQGRSDYLLKTPDTTRTIDDSEAARDLLRRFEREMHILADLTPHPNLVEALGCGVKAGRPYVVLARAPGKSLRAVLKGGALSLERSRGIISQILEALGHLHAAGVLHRDVTPSNVVVAADDHATLIDLGLAYTRQLTRLTRDLRTTLGTPQYLAPELVRALLAGDAAPAPSPARDVYGAGCLLYECVTGTRPFAGEAEELYARIVAPYRPDPRRLRPELPQTLSDLLRRAMALDPAQRPSAGEMHADLAALDRGSDRVDQEVQTHDRVAFALEQVDAGYRLRTTAAGRKPTGKALAHLELPSLELQSSHVIRCEGRQTRHVPRVLQMSEWTDVVRAEGFATLGLRVLDAQADSLVLECRGLGAAAGLRCTVHVKPAARQAVEPGA